jgi:DNA polymerase III alpha subunit
VVISQEPLKDVCPMTRDKEGNPIAALEMSALEDLGHVKFDFLSINFLDKTMMVRELIAER